MPFETPILAAAPAVLNFAVKGTQTSFELQQVPERTRALFETIASTRSDIVNAREMRIVLGKQYSADDLAEWDRSVRETEAALIDLERLVEPARIDLEHNDGKIRAKTRLMWVIKDSKSLSATSYRLTLAHQRMSFAMMMIHMKRDHDRRDVPSLPFEESAPPPYAIPKGIIKAAGDRSRSDLGRITRSRSVGSVGEDTAQIRSAPRSRSPVIRTLSHQEGDFNDLLHQHANNQARPRPPTEPLGPLLASMEALSNNYDPMLRLARPSPEQDSSNSRGQEYANPSVSLLSLNRLSTVHMNHLRPRQRNTVSPPITPPTSPYQTAINQPFPSTSELAVTKDSQPRILSSTTLNRLPTLREADSVRFELDANQEVQAINTPEPSQSHSRYFPPVEGMQPAERMHRASHIPPSQPRQGQSLPYPDDEDLGTYPSRSLEKRTASYPDSALPATSKTLTGLKSTPHFFAGHRQPVNIRWKPEPIESSANDMTKPPELSTQTSAKPTQNSADEYMYQPYRPR